MALLVLGAEQLTLGATDLELGAGSAITGAATTSQALQTIAASGSVSGGEVVTPVTPAITGGSSRARYPKLRIATPILPEPLRPVTGIAATGQGAQSAAGIASVSVHATAATAQAPQFTTAQADSNNLRLLREEDEFWLIAA